MAEIWCILFVATSTIDCSVDLDYENIIGVAISDEDYDHHKDLIKRMS